MAEILTAYALYITRDGAKTLLFIFASIDNAKSFGEFYANNAGKKDDVMSIESVPFVPPVLEPDCVAERQLVNAGKKETLH